jgi:hypothetical protein
MSHEELMVGAGGPTFHLVRKSQNILKTASSS